MGGNGRAVESQSFERYTRTGGPVVVHTNTEEMVAVAIRVRSRSLRATHTGRRARAIRDYGDFREGAGAATSARPTHCR